MKESNARWDEGKGRVKDALLGRYQSNVLSGLPSPPPPQTPEEWRLWGGSRLLADEEFAFGHVVGVWQDTCSWVRTQDQRDSEEGAAPGVWVGGLDLRVSSGQWIWNRREQARC